MAESYEPTEEELPYAVLDCSNNYPPLPPRLLTIPKEFHRSQTSLVSSLSISTYQNERRSSLENNKSRSSFTLNNTAINSVENFIRQPRDIFRVPSEMLLSPEIQFERTKNAVTENAFMLSKTMHVYSETFNRGVFVKAELNTSTGVLMSSYNNLEQLVEIYNNNDDIENVERSEIEKHIVTSILVKLRQERNIYGMSQLLHLSSSILRPIIESAILEATLEMQRKEIFTILEIWLLLDVLRMLRTDCSHSSNILLSVLNLLSELFMRKNREEFCQNCEKLQSNLKGKRRNAHVTVVKDFVHNLNKYGDLYLSEYSSEVEIEKRKRLFDKMTFSQKYVLIYTVLNRIITSNECDCSEQLMEIIPLLNSWKTKRKSGEVLYKDLMIRLVTTALCRLLANENFIDLHPESFLCQLLDAFDTIFINTNVSQETRLSLMELLEPLLLVSNREIVIRILAVFRKNCSESVQVAKLINSYVKQEILHTDIQVRPIKCLNDEVPTWKTSEGYNVSNRRSVTLNCLVPSLHCLASKNEPGKNCQSDHHHCLEVLRHLQDTTTHCSILQLFAYQVTPKPVFYITEKVSTLTLNEFLLTKRKSSKWLPTKDLLTIALEATDAVEYLQLKSVVHRDITTHSFRVCDRGSRLVLHDFSLALIFENGQQEMKTADTDSQGIPTLWSAPESIVEDKYSLMSDVWMLGNLIYELFTHGCRPYTEMYTFSVEKILQYVIFHDLYLKQWSCMPKDVYGLIRDLHHRKSSERPNIATIKDRLRLLIDAANKNKKVRLRFLEESDKLYPKFDVAQHSVERGIPDVFLQMKIKSLGDADSMYVSYQNLLVSQRVHTSAEKVPITELTAADRPTVEKRAGTIQVREPITDSVLQTLRDHMEGDTRKTVLMMPASPTYVEGSSLEGIDRMFEYEINCNVSVADLANSRQFGDPFEESAKQRYLEVILKMAEFVEEMNNRSWILGSMRCSDLYVTENIGKVVLARLGKLIWFNPSCHCDDYIVADHYSTDCMRWCPVEVIQHRHFSFASDVYSLAMTILEFYTTLSLHQRNPVACETEAAPFPNVSCDKLPEVLYSDGKPDQPEYCPDWLYTELAKCLSKDVEKRLSCKQLIREIKQNLECMTRYPDEEEYSNEPTNDGIEQGDDHYEKIVEFNCVNSDSDSEYENFD